MGNGTQITQMNTDYVKNQRENLVQSMVALIREICVQNLKLMKSVR
jgi:hypothetical protein